MWGYRKSVRSLLPLLLLIIGLAVACGESHDTIAENEPVASPTATPKPATTPTNTPEPSATPTDTREPTVTPTEKPEPTPSPTAPPEESTQSGEPTSQCSGPPVECYEPAAVEHLDQAMAYMEEAGAFSVEGEGRPDLDIEKLNLAIEELNQVIAIQTDAAEAYMMRGFVKYMVFEQQAIDLDPSIEADREEELASAFTEALSAFAEKGQWDLVIEDLEQAIADEPERADLILTLGVAHMYGGLFTALELKPELAEGIDDLFNQITDALNETN